MAKTNKQRQAESRARKKVALTVTIHLTEQEANDYQKAFDTQIHTDSKTTFAKASLLIGAKFRANSGNPKNKKIK